MSKPDEVPEDTTGPPPTPLSEGGGLERELYGKWTIMLRNVGGFLAAVTTCAIAIMNAYSTHVSIKNGGGWPDMLIMLIANVGPIVVVWTFMGSSKTISSILQTEGIGDSVRKRVANAIAPKDTPQ